MATSARADAAPRCLVCAAPIDTRFVRFCSWLCGAVWTALREAYALEGPQSSLAEAEPLLVRLAAGEPLSAEERKRLYAWLLRIEGWRARVARHT